MDLSKFIDHLKSDYADKEDGDVINTCPYCHEATHVIQTVHSDIVDFKAPCYIGCKCDKKEDVLPSTNYRGTGIPPRYQNVESKFYCDGSGYLFGKSKTGKTTAACSIGTVNINFKRSVRFVTMEEVRRHEFADKDKGMAFSDELTAVDLLIIDDIGTSETSEWSVSLLFNVINNRYNSMKDVLITSNYSLTELRDRLASCGAPKTAEAITRRIQDMCVPYKFGQGDLR